MIIGSHNSWSYLPCKEWWMKPFNFMAKCQCVDIKTQYEKYNVRCFDLRLFYTKGGHMYISHGFIKYKITYRELYEQLNWLNNKKDCYVRVLLETRKKSQYTEVVRQWFQSDCDFLEYKYKNIHFWCGRNLYNWKYDYTFTSQEPTCEEKHASVCLPKLIDDWLPKLYAFIMNKKNISKGTDKEILLIDFVNIQ